MFHPSSFSNINLLYTFLNHYFTSLAIKKCSHTLEIRFKSTLPPEITATTFYPVHIYQPCLQEERLWLTLLLLLRQPFRVAISLSSLLLILLPIQLQFHLLGFTISKVKFPGILTAQPSAIVGAL